MRTPSPSLLLSFAASVMFIGTPTSRASVTVVSWGGDYVAPVDSPNQLQRRPDGTTLLGATYKSGLDLDGDTVADDSRFGAPLSTSTPLSPATNYGGSTGQSATFYGGVAINIANTTLAAPDTLAVPNFGVHNGIAGNDHIEINTQHSQNDHHTFSSLIYWDQNDFLNGANTSTVIFDATSSLSLTTLGDSNFGADTHLHMIVRDGTQFYVSQAFWGGTGADLTELGYQGAIADGGTMTFDASNTYWDKWALYYPASDAEALALGFTHGSYNPTTFSDITGLGFFMDNRTFSQNNNKIVISGFSASATPEPSRALLLMGGLIPIVLRRRRRC